MKSPSSFRLLSPEYTSVKASHVLLVNSMAMWMLAFTTTSINIALPSIQTELNLGAVALGWLPLAYILASAIFLLPLGKIADRFGRRLLYLMGLVIFFISSLALVFADSYVPLVAFRSGQGFGGALMFAGSTAMITLVYPPERRGRAMGINVAVVYLGQTMGPVLGGVIVFNIGWRGLFFIAAGYALINLGLDLWLLRRAEWKDEGTTGFDWPGSMVYAVALAMFLFGLSWLPQVQGLTMIVVGIAGMALFVWWETRARSPIIEVSLFRHNRVFAFSNLAALISYASVWAMSFLMSLYLQYIKGLNAQTAGLVLVVGVAFQALFSLPSGRLSDRVQPRWVASGGMALCTIGLVIFSFLMSDTPYWYIFMGLILLGLGYAFFSTPNQSSIMGSVDRRYVGIAGASVGTMRVVGQAISISLATMVLGIIVGQHEIRPADYPHLLTAIRVSFGMMAVLCVVGIAASLARGSMPPQKAPVEAPLPAAEL
jgi:EmrB/QacA subfamily drug resistance transporter